MTAVDTAEELDSMPKGPRHVRRPTTPWWARRWSIALWVLLSYQVLSTIILWPLISRGLTTHLPFGTDAVLDSWGYSWLPHAITNWLDPFVTNYVNYPNEVNLLANTTQLALALVEWPITAVAGPTASFNIACLVAPTLSAASMYLLARILTERRILAWIGGLLYGFGAYMLTALGSFHFQLFFVPIPPLLFLALHHLVVVRRWRAPLLGLAIAALVTVQFFISTEVLMTTVIMAAIAGLCAALLCPHPLLAAWRYVLTTLGVAAGATVLLLGWPAWVALAGPGRISGLVILTPQAYRADLAGPIFPTTTQALAPSRAAEISSHFATAVSENYSYLGIPLLVATLVGIVVLRRNRMVLVSAFISILAFVLSLGGGLAVAGTPTQGAIGTEATGSWLPGRLLEKLPLFENVIPSRWALFTAIGVALIFVALLDRIVASHRSKATTRGGIAGAVVLCLLVVVPLTPRLPLGEATISVDYALPAHMKKLVTTTIPEGDAAITFPYPTGDNFMRPVTWQSAMDFPFKMPAGYFRVPQGRDRHVGFDSVYGYGFSSYPAQVLVQLERGSAPAFSPSVRLAFVAPLNRWGIHWLVADVAGTRNPKATRYYLALLLGAPVSAKGPVAIYRVPNALDS